MTGLATIDQIAGPGPERIIVAGYLASYRVARNPIVSCHDVGMIA